MPDTMPSNKLAGLDPTKSENISAFRAFVNNKWYEHKDEIFDWTGSTVDYNSTYYFNQHKWLLRSMFRRSQ